MSLLIRGCHPGGAATRCTPKVSVLPVWHLCNLRPKLRDFNNHLIVDLSGGERHTLPNPGGQVKLTLLFRNEAGVIVWHAQTKRHYEPPGQHTEGSIIPRSLMIIIPPDTGPHHQRLRDWVKMT